MVQIRKAKETERNCVALCIAEGFEADFAILCKDTQKVADAIAGGLNIPRFFVADMDGEIAGVLAISDGGGRAARVEKASLKRQFGVIKGWIGALVLKEEFEAPLEYPSTTGYIEFVAVRKKYRRQGIATAMLRESMRLTEYREFVLDVVETSEGARKCYANVGFEVFRGSPEKHGKIYMRYCRK